MTHPFSPPSAPLPRQLTTLDVLKTWALVLMVVDHIGFYFLPETGAFLAEGDPHLWWRAFGRLCVPVWFFLIGYARTRDLSPPLWVAAGIVLASSLVCGLWVFPLNILFTMILIRLIIDPVGEFALRSTGHLAITITLIILSSFHTFFLVEYGSVGLLVALPSYLERLPINILYWSSWFLLLAIQSMFFSFDRTQLAVVALGTAGILYILQNLQVRELPETAARLGPGPTFIVQMLGRQTLWFYVIHIIVFRAIAWHFGLGLPIYGWFDTHLWIWDDYAAARAG
jgi:hypothetical protein